LLTVGGTPLDAMQRYGPICSRVTRVISSSEPSILAAATVCTDAGVYKFAYAYIHTCIYMYKGGLYSALLHAPRSSLGEARLAI